MKQDYQLVFAQIVLIGLYIMEVQWIELSLPYWLRYLALIDVAFGVIILLAGLLKLGNNLTPLPRPKRDGELVTGGIFAYIRHPIYAGIIFIMAGGSLYFSSTWKMLMATFIWLVFYYKSKLEESYLTEKFDDYESYKESSGRFFPKIK